MGGVFQAEGRGCAKTLGLQGAFWGPEEGQGSECRPLGAFQEPHGQVTPCALCFVSPQPLMANLPLEPYPLPRTGGNSGQNLLPGGLRLPLLCGSDIETASLAHCSDGCVRIILYVSIFNPFFYI